MWKKSKYFRSPDTGMTSSLGKVSQWRWWLTRCCEVDRNVLKGEGDERHSQDEGVDTWETRGSGPQSWPGKKRHWID